jgi:hypothetical protein
VVPPGAGTDSIDQAVPFHRSTSGTTVVALAPNPTATQSLVDTHDTLTSTLSTEPAGLGVVWIDHVVPFQSSASVTFPDPLE